MQFLKYLLSNSGNRCNINGFSKSFNVKRSTVYEALNRLIEKKLVTKEHYGNHSLTEAGKHYLETVGLDRRVCRDAPDVSYVRDHKFTFELTVFEFPKGWDAGIVAYVDSDSVQTKLQNFSKNNKILYADFPDDVSVTFTTRKAIIKPKNIFVNSHSEASHLAIVKASQVVERLFNAGFKVSDSNGVVKLIQKEGHFAEVNSLLSEFFEKHALGFKVPGRDGKPLFWIDHSDGHREDETASEEARDRLQKVLFDVMDNDVPLPSQHYAEFLQLKELVVAQSKVWLVEHMPKKEHGEIVPIERPDYFG